MVFDPISLASTVQALLPHILKLLAAHKSVGKDFRDRLALHLPQSLKNYGDRFAEYQDKLKVLEMSKPVNLLSVYTNVQVYEEPRFKRLEKLQTLERLARNLPGRNLKLPRSPRRDGLAVISENQYLVVLGEPGAGKTTLLKRAGLEALKGKNGQLQAGRIPVFLELRRLSLNQLTLEEAICREFAICNFPESEAFVKAALQQGKLLVLLDGLDEVSEKNRNQLVDSIQSFVDRYPQNQYILSCRTPAYRYNLQQFTDVEVADFDDTQIQTAINHWFDSELDREAGTAVKCWQLLLKPENAATKELARTPLLLTFICLVFDRDMSLPDNRGFLYGKALDILLSRWNSEKRIERDLTFYKLYPELEKLLLAEIAYEGFKTDQLFFSEQQLLDRFQDFFAETHEAPASLDSQALLNAIEVQQGVLVKQAESTYSFSHLTLQEYLAARYVAIEPERLRTLVNEHLTDSRWRDIFVLSAGLVHTGDGLLLSIEEKARTFIDTPRLQRLIGWVDTVTRDQSGQPGTLTQRIFASLIALTLAHDHAYARALVLLRALAFAYKFDLAETFDSARLQAQALATDLQLDLPDLVYELVCRFKELEVFPTLDVTLLAAKLDVLKLKSKELSQSAVTECLWALLLEIFQLDPRLMDLSEEELIKLEQYLDTNLLLLQCKKSAVRVLNKTWQRIESRMLLADAAVG